MNAPLRFLHILQGRGAVAPPGPAALTFGGAALSFAGAPLTFQPA